MKRRDFLRALGAAALLPVCGRTARLAGSERKRPNFVFFLLDDMGWLYEGGIREPMMVKWPGVVKPGSVCDEPVTSTDFYPTMLDMAGLPANPRQHRDGASMVPLLKGTGRPKRHAIYWHYPHYSNQGGKPGGAVRAGDFKLIEFYEDNRVELYNLRADLGEQHDLTGEMPEKTAELRRMLHKWRQEVGAVMPQPNPNWKE